MEFDFKPSPQSLFIPKDAYRPIKKCPFCMSVYITDTRCESCDRSIDFNLVGLPFSAKSYYRIKEKYIADLPLWVKMYPIFEDKSGVIVKSYVRNLVKRFKDLLLGFSSPDIMKVDDRKFFYFEAKEIVNELIEYGYSTIDLNQLVMEHNCDELVLQELLIYINSKKDAVFKNISWEYILLKHKLWGILRVEFLLRVSIVLAAVIYAAMNLKSFFSH